MQEKKIKIAIVDDHQIIIDGLVALLSKHSLLHIAVTASNGEAMLQLLSVSIRVCRRRLATNASRA